MIINRSAWWSGVVLFAMTNLPAQNRKAGKVLRLAPPEMEKLRRWKVGSRNRGYTKDQEDVHAAFSELWKDRRLDTNRVFLYKGKPWKNPRTAYAAACRRAGVDTMTAMKIVCHKSEQMNSLRNMIQPEDLNEAAAKRQKYTANTVITLVSSAASGQAVSNCNFSVGA